MSNLENKAAWGLDEAEWTRQFVTQFLMRERPASMAETREWFKAAIQAGYDAARALDPDTIEVRTAPFTLPTAGTSVAEVLHR